MPQRFVIRPLGRSIAFVIALLLVGTRPSSAAEALQLRPALDLSLTTVATSLWIASELAKDQLAPSDCRFCEPNAIDDSLARSAVWDDRTMPGLFSDAGLVALPLMAAGTLALAAGQERRLDTLPTDLLLVAESVAIAQVVNQAAKFAAARQRPFLRWLDADARLRSSSDDNLSFFSGHTTFSFAAITSTWSVARARQSPWATPILVAGVPLASLVGYLRMAAGKHYLTDVVTGAVVGACIGLVIPRLHERSGGTGASSMELSIQPWSTSGFIATASWSL